jgi:hypothetical protein
VLARPFGAALRPPARLPAGLVPPFPCALALWARGPAAAALLGRPRFLCAVSGGGIGPVNHRIYGLHLMT